MTRDTQIDQFLKTAGLNDFERIKIPGDASFRHYEKIIAGKDSYILMDSPPDKEDVKPFIKIDEILLDLELSAPKIFEQDVENGFLLLENFGDKKFNKLFNENPEREEELYKLAIDALDKIYDQRKILKNYDILPYTREKLLAEAMLFIDWYMVLFHRIEGDKKDRLAQKYTNIINNVLDKLKLPNDVMVLRDYHADNLMLLEDRTNAQKVGLLDFQDALLGNVAYDVVSLLEDARRDVPKNIQTKMIDYFVEKSGIKNKADFVNDYNILGAQRNLKIIGIFSRLKVRDKKEVYIPLIPRVKNYLMQDLEHESLKELKEFLQNECQL